MKNKNFNNKKKQILLKKLKYNQWEHYTISGVARKGCEPKEYRTLGWSLG
jgi:hypothetical protein